MKIVFSKDAKDDLIRLKQFIFIKNPRAANRIIDELIMGMKKLIELPEMGIEVKISPSPKHVRDIYILKYQVRYLILSEEIKIIRIWHQKEDR